MKTDGRLACGSLRALSEPPRPPTAETAPSRPVVPTHGAPLFHETARHPALTSGFPLIETCGVAQILWRRLGRQATLGAAPSCCSG